MRKKNDTTKKATAPAARIAKPATTKKAPVRPAATSPAKPGPARPKRATPPPAAVAPSTGDIALRAYFIAEKRRANGLPGDEHQDWIEAERQLRAEAAAPKPAGKKRPAKSKAA